MDILIKNYKMTMMMMTMSGDSSKVVLYSLVKL